MPYPRQCPAPHCKVPNGYCPHHSTGVSRRVGLKLD